MEPLLPLLAFAIVVSVASLVSRVRRQAQLEAWQRSAERCQLRECIRSEGGLFGGASLEGEAGELQVRLESYRRGKYERGTRIVVSGLGHGHGGLALRREGLATAFEKNVVGEREIELGDATFDREQYVRGNAAMAFAALGPEARSPLSRLLCGHVAGGPGEPVSVDAVLADGRLEVRVRESGFSSANRQRLPEILARVLEIARPLIVRGDLPARIAANIVREPDDGVRLRAVGLLAREFPGHPATVERLRAALADPSDEVRLRAATALGDDGRETLLQLVARAADDACVGRAIAVLGPNLPGALAEATLRGALAAGEKRHATALACLEQLREHGRAEAQPVLLQALTQPDDPTAEAAARALGRIGDVTTVSALLDAAATRPRGPYRQAIAEIQSRRPGAGAGQLSISSGEAGALSLARDEEGALSLADTPEPPVAEAAEVSADAAPLSSKPEHPPFAAEREEGREEERRIAPPPAGRIRQ